MRKKPAGRIYIYDKKFKKKLDMAKIKWDKKSHESVLKEIFKKAKKDRKKDDQYFPKL